jgi:hypothetical protein
MLLERGNNDLGIQAVLDATGVPRGSFYHHFESKEDFALQVVDPPGWGTYGGPSVELESCPPVLYLLEQSGHGTSSLLNALAGRPVAQVGHVRPQTPGADPHLITFQEVFSEWKVVDARGIFETPVEATEGNVYVFEATGAMVTDPATGEEVQAGFRAQKLRLEGSPLGAPDPRFAAGPLDT